MQKYNKKCNLKNSKFVMFQKNNIFIIKFYLDSNMPKTSQNMLTPLAICHYTLTTTAHA